MIFLCKRINFCFAFEAYIHRYVINIYSSNILKFLSSNYLSLTSTGLIYSRGSDFIFKYFILYIW